MIHSQGSEADRGIQRALFHLCSEKSEEGGFEALRSVLHHIVLGDQSLLQPKKSDTQHNAGGMFGMMASSRYAGMTSSDVIMPLRDAGQYLAVQNAVLKICSASKTATGGILMESMGWSNDLPISTYFLLFFPSFLCSFFLFSLFFFSCPFFVFIL